MKNLLLLFAFSLSLGFANAQTNPAPAAKPMDKPAAKPMEKPAAKPMDKPAAKPADAAKPAADAKKMDSKMADMNTKDHVCTAACKDGKHVYAHGEKGHTCTAACHKAMGKSKKTKKAAAAAPAEKKS
jgi:predicted component of type VI protein secretion system